MMKARHMIMALGVVGAGWLALFGDKTPNNDVAEAVATPRDRAAKSVAQPVQATPANTATDTATGTTSDSQNTAHSGKPKREHARITPWPPVSDS